MCNDVMTCDCISKHTSSDIDNDSHNVKTFQISCNFKEKQDKVILHVLKSILAIVKWLHLMTLMTIFFCGMNVKTIIMVYELKIRYLFKQWLMIHYCSFCLFVVFCFLFFVFFLLLRMLSLFFVCRPFVLQYCMCSRMFSIVFARCYIM